MNILIDFHHDELHESLLKLFEDRFSFDVYTPIGEEWQSEGFWGISNNPATISQYLYINKNNTDVWKEISPGIYNKKDCSRYRKTFKYISLESARDIKWDIILSSHPHQFEFYKRFAEKYSTKSKLVMQFGNMMPGVPDGCFNILNSTSSDHYLNLKGLNVVNYNQEFCTELLDTYNMPLDIKSIYTFLLYNAHHNKSLYDSIISELNWKSREYGNGNEDGHITNYNELIEEIKNAGFIWHYKRSGDGYGHTLYKSFFAGRPVILNMRMFQFHRLYHNKFLEDGISIINCNDGFNDDDLSIEMLKRKIFKYLDNYQTNSKIIFERIRNEVDFDKEFIKIKNFIENLK